MFEKKLTLNWDVNQVLIEYWAIVNWDVNQVLIEYWAIVNWDVNQVLIEYWAIVNWGVNDVSIECQSRDWMLINSPGVNQHLTADIISTHKLIYVMMDLLKTLLTQYKATWIASVLVFIMDVHVHHIRAALTVCQDEKSHSTSY